MIERDGCSEIVVFEFEHACLKNTIGCLRQFIDDVKRLRVNLNHVAYVTTMMKG
jgi:hypothetical protein